MTPTGANATNNRVRLTGELDASTVPDLLTHVDSWVAGPAAGVDLDGVGRTDSAGVALLLEITRRARAAGREIRFHNPPAQMQAIISLCALDEILPIES